MAMEVDLVNKPKETAVPQPMFSNNFSDKTYDTKDDEFPFQVPTEITFEDFHHLNHHPDQFHPDGSSPGPITGVQIGSNFDPFDGTSSVNMDFFEYDIKPFGDPNSTHQYHHPVVGHDQEVMDNFQIGGGGYLNLPMLPQRNHPIDLVGPNQDHNQIDINPQANMSMHLQDAMPVNFVVPDEFSCVTASQYYYKNKVGINNKNNGGNSSSSSSNSSKNNNNTAPPSTRRTSGKNRKKSSVVKGQWTAGEDRLLIQLVEQHGIRKWSLIAQLLPGRIGKQCRERWHNHLRPDIKKDTWTEEEDKVLIEAHAEIGNKWAEIAKRLPGRTENSIKNHWNATKRKQYSKRKCRSKYPRGSLLQEYIKSLNLDAPVASTTGTGAGRVRGGKASVADNANMGISTNNNNIDTIAKVPNCLPQELDFCLNDRLVPTFDFNEVPDFDFDEKMFQEGGCCNINSLLDDIPCAPVVDEKSFCVDDVPCEDVSPLLMDGKVNKKMDLGEMVPQARM